MQSAKNAMTTAKETVANIGASAKSGMDKTKATLQEKAEKLTAQHPADKEMAEQTKEERIREAEINKREAMEQNAAAKDQAAQAGGYTSTGQAAGLTAGHQTRATASPMPQKDYVVEGVSGSHPR